MSDAFDEAGSGSPDLVILPSEMAGVWANDFEIARSAHEVTVDFARVDHGASTPGQGILVARVAFSYPMLSRFCDELTREWQAYVWQNEEVLRRGSEGETPDPHVDT